MSFIFIKRFFLSKICFYQNKKTSLQTKAYAVRKLSSLAFENYTFRIYSFLYLNRCPIISVIQFIGVLSGIFPFVFISCSDFE
jgi:hypothetical protein